MPDGAPPTSYEYGHRIDRSERSEETYRIGGLMDMIDATEILKNTLGEIIPGVGAEQRERWAQAMLARLTNAPEHPLLVCRVYEMASPDTLAAAAGLLAPLNAYTTAVLEAVADVKAPPGWSISVAADSDVVVTCDDAGEWGAVSMRGRGEKARWVWARGSIGYPDRREHLWDSLGEAVASLVAAYEEGWNG